MSFILLVQARSQGGQGGSRPPRKIFEHPHELIPKKRSLSEEIFLEILIKH